MLCRRGVLPIVVLFMVAGLVGVLLLNLNRVEKQQQHYQQHTEMLEISYRAAIQTYQLATEIYLRDTIQQPELLALYAQVWPADGAARAKLRRQLHGLLQDSYRTLWQHRLRQLHFHLPDGESFLRFHQPERFGDKLFSVRPSVRIANTEHRVVVGFEAGRIIDGFRYVAPLAYRGRPIGSVETSIPFRSVQNAMAAHADGREYQLLVHAALIQERLFPEFSSAYTASSYTGDWLIENPARKQPDSSLPLSETVQAVAARLGADASIVEKMGRYESFSVGLVQQGVGYVVSFLPIREITGGMGGYLVSYVQEPLVVTLRHSFLWEVVGFALLLLAAFWLLVRWRCSVAELAEQTAHRQYEETLQLQQERVELEERGRISRELHDGIGQALHAVTLRLKLLATMISPERIEEREAIGQLLHDVGNASAELRQLVAALRPLSLSGMKIDEAIRWLCRNLEKDGNLSLLLQTAGSFDDVSDSSSLALFRIVQEALTNILKHAAAKRVQVVLQRQENLLALTISDDGQGGAANPADGAGSGLKIMRERAELAGGCLQIDSPQGQGTRIFVEVPCRS